MQRALSSSDIPRWTGPDVSGKSVVELAHIFQDSRKISGIGQFGGRFAVRADPEFAAALLKAAFVGLSDLNALVETWGRVVDVINVPLYEEANEDLKAALNGVRTRINYARLDPHGPKLGEISAK